MAMTDEQLERLGVLLGTVNSAFDSQVQTLARQKIQHEAWLRQMSQKLNITKDEVKLLEEKYKREAAKEIRDKQISERQYEGAKQFVGTLKDLYKGTAQAAQGLYNTDQAFSGVVPLVTLMGSTIGNVTSAIAKMTTGWSILGFSFGGMAEGAAKLVGVGIDIATQIAQQQLENAQKFVNSFNLLSKAGVTFGGSLTAMTASAVAGRLNLESYAKFITTNIETLSRFGGSTEAAASQIMNLTKSAIANNDKLVVMYGSYEAINEAAAEYVSTMAMSGMNISKNIGALNAGAAAYLFNMKELSNLTGQTADTIRKEQEARMKSSAYQMALAKMAPEQAAAARNQVSLVTRMYGKEAGDYLEELIATGGNVISETGLTFKAMLGPIPQAIEEMFRGGFGEGATARTAEVMSKYADVIFDFANRNQQLMQLNYGVQDQTLQQMNSVLSQTLMTINRQRDLSAAQVDIAAAAAAPLEKSSKDLKGVIDALNDFKIQMDTLTAKNFKNMVEVTKNLIQTMATLTEMIGPEVVGKALSKFTAAVKEATDALMGVKKAAPPTGATRGEEGTAPYGETGGGAATGRRGGVRRRPLPAGEQSGDLKLFDERLNIKTGERGALGEGKTFDPRLAEILNKYVNEQFPISQITALNDAYHKDAKSKHRLGQAVDFTLGRVPTAEEGRGIVAQLKDLGFSYVKDEYNEKSPGWTGPHIHAELKTGGITRGPSLAGEAGPEAVVPLPDGRNIPVKMDVGELVTKLEELISVAKEQRDNSEKMLYASL